MLPSSPILGAVLYSEHFNNNRQCFGLNGFFEVDLTRPPPGLFNPTNDISTKDQPRTLAAAVDQPQG